MAPAQTSFNLNNTDASQIFHVKRVQFRMKNRLGVNTQSLILRV